MTEELKQYEKTINTKHRLGWTPKYEERFQTTLNPSVLIAISVKTFEKLKWDIVYQDDKIIEAKRSNSWGNWTEKISVTYEYNYVKVKSISLGNEMWDIGRNSKRVKLFIYAFQQTEKGFDHSSLLELEKELEKSNNWDDYQIPASLPQPEIRKTPNFYIPLTGGIITALLCGYIVAFLSVEFIYIIGLFELGVAFLLVLTLKYLIEAGNYTNFNKLQKLLVGMIIMTYLSNQYFQYQIISDKAQVHDIGFLEFMKYRFEAGLTIKNLNTGWIGLIISWVVQLGLTYLIAIMRLSSAVTKYRLKRIPTEVLDFAFYHFVKEKTEEEVRSELDRMGWKDKQSQDEVIESVVAITDANELNRME